MTSCKISRPGCLVLLCGIPGSGKTTFAQELFGHCSPPDGSPFFLVPLHTDFFYPLDCRALQIEDVDEFNLKEARRKVKDCLRHLIHVNSVGLPSQAEQDCLPPDSLFQWEKLVQWLSDHKLADSAGKFSFPGNVAIVIDENLHLRSMRHEYYQMARDYSLGFVEVFLQCLLSTALTRNAHRPVPLPPSTIERLDQTAEPPDPEGHHWEEGRNISLNTDCCWTSFISGARTKVLLMVAESFSKPVRPLISEDLETKVLCRLENLHNHVHQADIVLRKCISEGMNKRSGGGKLELASLARRANSVRRDILEQLKNGQVEICWKFEADSKEFKSKIEELFLSQLYDTK